MPTEFEYELHPKYFTHSTFHGMKTYKGYPELITHQFAFPMEGYSLTVHQMRHNIHENLINDAPTRTVHTRVEYCVAGESQLAGRDRKIEYRPGRLFVFTRDDYFVHPLGKPKNYEYFCMMFDIEDHGLAEKDVSEVDAVHTIVVPALYVDLSEAQRRKFEYRLFKIVRIMAARPPSAMLRVREQILALLSLCVEWDVFRIVNLRKESFARHWRHHLWVEKAKRFIVEHFADKILVKDIGRYAGVDPGYLNKLFRAETGQSLNQYLNDLRIATAKSMLRMGETDLTAVAFAAGFRDSSYFSTRFRQATGRSPRQYLRQYAGEH
ncbi:MAG: helix-turn-helix transcriptional regulator [Kiritimatiellae bacterium]|nr:helix-turn-helix transcriptional regulator [Kiritimatiellia bacterium]